MITFIDNQQQNDVTEIYTDEYNYVEEELVGDEYNGYDEYGGYDLGPDVEINDCDLNNTIYDLTEGDNCNHADFRELVPLGQIEEFSNLSSIKQCCPFHGYLFQDSCEVRKRWLLAY